MVSGFHVIVTSSNTILLPQHSTGLREFSTLFSWHWTVCVSLRCVNCCRCCCFYLTQCELLRLLQQTVAGRLVLKGEPWKFGFIKRVDEDLITPWRMRKELFHGGNSTFIHSFRKTKFSCFTLPPTQHHSSFRNYKLVLKFGTKRSALKN